MNDALRFLVALLLCTLCCRVLLRPQQLQAPVLEGAVHAVLAVQC